MMNIAVVARRLVVSRNTLASRRTHEARAIHRGLARRRRSIQGSERELATLIQMPKYSGARNGPACRSRPKRDDASGTGRVPATAARSGRNAGLTAAKASTHPAIATVVPAVTSIKVRSPSEASPTRYTSTKTTTPSRMSEP